MVKNNLKTEKEALVKKTAEKKDGKKSRGRAAKKPEKCGNPKGNGGLTAPRDLDNS